VTKDPKRLRAIKKYKFKTNKDLLKYAREIPQQSHQLCYGENPPNSSLENTQSLDTLKDNKIIFYPNPKIPYHN
jgi:hypothetical protein